MHLYTHPLKDNEMKSDPYQYGELTVIDDRTTIWECECSCGRRCLVKSLKLRRGLTTSCGCQPQADPPFAVTTPKGQRHKR